MEKIQTTLSSPHCAKYLVTLCRHFARKVPAEWDEHSGEVTFAMGTCRFSLGHEGQQLDVLCEAENKENLHMVRQIIEHHLTMFSRRETLAVKWQ